MYMVGFAHSWRTQEDPTLMELSEIVIKRRLETVRQLIEEYGLVAIKLVPSEMNISDALTRVSRKSLQMIAQQTIQGKKRKAKLLHLVQQDKRKVQQ